MLAPAPVLAPGPAEDEVRAIGSGEGMLDMGLVVAVVVDVAVGVGMERRLGFEVGGFFLALEGGADMLACLLAGREVGSGSWLVDVRVVEVCKG